jgi:serine-aspartate repeat-containing protein C/D/E
VGLLSRVSRLARKWRRLDDNTSRNQADGGRARRFETMEPRRLLAADVLQLGAVFVEEDLGSDLQGDTFEITFEGGAADTELTRLVIDGDQDAPGFGEGDVFFDTALAGFGADNAFPFTLLALETVDPSASVAASVVDGESRMVLELAGFQAGDKLTFGIDVDEVEDFDPTASNLSLINEGFDPITSGVEFQGSQLTAHFSAPHYYATTGTGEFRNRYDEAFAGTNLKLPADNDGGLRDRRDGVLINAEQSPLPVSIGGTVYLDHDLDLHQDPGERGLSGVELSLWRSEGGQYQATGHTTVTSATGGYAFGLDLNLLPGVYEVREAQSAGLFSVGSVPGTVAGNPAGTIVNGNPDRLTAIGLPLGGEHAINFDFAEARPVSLSGHVYHDENGDGARNGNEEGLIGVAIDVIPLETIAPQATKRLATNEDGFYQVNGLVPGTYRVVEMTQPGGYFDGFDSAGTVDGQTRGMATNPGDSLEDISLLGGDDGIEYNFGEIAPASLGGTAHLSDADGDCFGETPHPPLQGVVIRLFDGGGNLVDETTTNIDGEYRFEQLLPGEYSLVEVTPEGLLDGPDRVGTIGGFSSGQLAGNDRISSILLGSGERGLNFDFCERAPVKIGGFVYHDHDNDGIRDPDEEGIGGVSVTVIPVATQAPQEAVTVVTSEDGMYMTGMIAPGRYRIVEQQQPAGYFDGLDAAGTVDGQPQGRAANPGDAIDEIFLTNGQIGADFNFGELLPASIAGRVHLSDADDNCFQVGALHRPVEGVEVMLLDSRGEMIAETRTDSDGQYTFSDLLPGSYTVVERTPVGLLDGGERAGRVGGRSMGEVSGNDTIAGIELLAGQHGINFDFCEHAPAAVSGFVYHDANDNAVLDLSEDGIGGVTVTLLDANNQAVATRQTGEDGFYRFDGLRAGTYSIRERQPDDWLDGRDTAGLVGGVVVGQATNPGDLIREVQLRYGDDGTHYDFGELAPVKIGGVVYHDRNNNGIRDPNEDGIGDVAVTVISVAAQAPQEAVTLVTSEDGMYMTGMIAPGRYRIVEQQQPLGYLDGLDTAGTVDGQPQGRPTNPGDAIDEIFLASGQTGANFNFGELLPASITGVVHSDPNGNCRIDGAEAGIAGVTIDLLDGNDKLVASTRTDANGRYEFGGLLPGRYSVRETQPRDHFHGGQWAGSGNGQDQHQDLLTMDVVSGDALVDYNFCELPPSQLSGYVFQDGKALTTRDGSVPPLISELRDGIRTADDTPIVDVVLELRNGLSGDSITGDTALPGFYSSPQIQTTTDANGFYEFRGLRGDRSYSVYEIHPAGYIDGVDTAGTTSGVAINPGNLQAELLISQLVQQPNNDAILRIAVQPGQISEENNFSEIIVTSTTLVPPNERVALPNHRPDLATPQLSAPALAPFGAITPTSAEIPLFGGGTGFTWHLSVVDAGMPRGVDSADFVDAMIWRQVTFLDSTKWQSDQLRHAEWFLKHEQESSSGDEFRRLVFGVPGGIPVSGDFNGDGLDEVGVYLEGEWFIDLNGNGHWDAEDLWAKLGGRHDRPIAGDWDGDGKDDIGIFGPAWPNDLRAINAEPGLPDALNARTDRPKNLPPLPEEAADGHRLLRLRANGPRRADLIDHVFRFGSSQDIPFAADLNGDGIASIGVFRDGHWKIDVDGDGRFGRQDQEASYGNAGDIPVVGDFDGDGVDEIGVYRAGRWQIDSNHNLELDAHDQVFEMGGGDDQPVVGDWDGDGADDPGVYRE